MMRRFLNELIRLPTQGRRKGLDQDCGILERVGDEGQLFKKQRWVLPGWIDSPEDLESSLVGAFKFLSIQDRYTTTP